jgi:hypothetical protein
MEFARYIPGVRVYHIEDDVTVRTSVTEVRVATDTPQVRV